MRSVAWTLGLLVISFAVVAESAPLLILHTNDLHDHMRPDYDGAGGLAYVSGYIKSVTSERDDTIVLDAGDVMEKGDIVAFRAKSTLMYEAMNDIGFHATAPGNHDDAYGLEHLTKCDELSPDMDVLCINLFREDGSLRFPASKIYEVGPLKVGVIGMIRPRDELSLDIEASAEAIAKEAAKLDEEAHLIVVTCHVGPRNCAAISEIAPMVDVFVSGHTHQALEEPLVVEGTGALIVQAGSYADYVGRLGLEVDLETEAIEVTEGRLVEMVHGEVPCDEEMLAWIREHEENLAPEADDFVFNNPDEIGYLPIGHLAAEAMRQTGEADIAFCHTGQIIRDSLPEGQVDVNAVFRTGGQRAYDLYEVEMTGELIEAYLNGLSRSGWGQTQWAGFKADRRKTDSGVRSYVTNLERGKTYRVVISKKEWETRLLRFFERYASDEGTAESRITSLEPKALDFTFTDAAVAYIKSLDLEAETVEDHARDLADKAELGE